MIDGILQSEMYHKLKICVRNIIKMSIQLSNNQSTNTYNLLSFLMSASISANSFS